MKFNVEKLKSNNVVLACCAAVAVAALGAVGGIAADRLNKRLTWEAAVTAEYKKDESDCYNDLKGIFLITSTMDGQPVGSFCMDDKMDKILRFRAAAERRVPKP